MDDAAFIGNVATRSDGGALHVGEGAEAYLAGINFSSNRAGGGGGAVASTLSGDLLIERCYFARNMAQDGGGLFVGPPLDGIIRVRNSTFKRNFAGDVVPERLHVWASFPAPAACTSSRRQSSQA